jgi:hypothetical protein
MPRTRTFTEFTPEGILSQMEPGRDYRTGYIAQSLKVGNVEVRKMLDSLVEQGKLGMRFDEAAHEWRFHRDSSVAVEVIEAPAESKQVAERRSLGDILSRNLTNYEGEMRERVALCLLARGM